MFLGLLASVAPNLVGSKELVRIRNALVFEDYPLQSFDWGPDARPADYVTETAAPYEEFKAGIATLNLSQYPTDLDRAKAIARHLLMHPNAGRGGAIQASLRSTYQRILTEGKGYCGDYSRTYTALALAAGIESRSWAFSFDGYGGHGHVFNEIWDSTTHRWVAIDTFMNVIPVDAGGTPLSAMEFRQALTRSNAPPILTEILKGRFPPYEHPDDTLAYYRRGVDQWWMWWGNAVFSRDSTFLVKMMGSIGHPGGHLGAVVAGVFPKLRPIETAVNADARKMLRGLQRRLIALAVVGAALLLSWIIGSVQRRRAKRLLVRSTP